MSSSDPQAQLHDLHSARASAGVANSFDHAAVLGAVFGATSPTATIWAQSPSAVDVPAAPSPLPEFAPQAPAPMGVPSAHPWPIQAGKQFSALSSADAATKGAMEFARGLMVATERSSAALLDEKVARVRAELELQYATRHPIQPHGVHGLVDRALGAVPAERVQQLVPVVVTLASLVAGGWAGARVAKAVGATGGDVVGGAAVGAVGAALLASFLFAPEATAKVAAVAFAPKSSPRLSRL